MPTGLEFEHTFRLLLGDKARHSASNSDNPKRRAHWLKVALNKIELEINILDSTDRHKQMLLNEVIVAK